MPLPRLFPAVLQHKDVQTTTSPEDADHTTTFRSSYVLSRTIGVEVCCSGVPLSNNSISVVPPRRYLPCTYPRDPISGVEGDEITTLF